MRRSRKLRESAVAARAAKANDQDFASGYAVRLPFPLRWMLLRPRDTLAVAAAGGAVITILINALFLQTGPHPAPIFANKPVPVVAPQPDPLASIMPHRRPGAVSKPDVVTATRPRSDTVMEIQRELTRRGFYDGPADGFYGPKTDAAIRDFEQVAGLRASAEPGEPLLAAITRSNVKAKPAETPRDPIAALLAPSGRIIGVQRALIEFGYGPLAANGTYDAATRAAIERFEKARKRPVTGQITDQLVRDLSTLTGRPLE
jgi:peptidoglycan hydrolase-like protein with peptidoglycan-binding domain